MDLPFNVPERTQFADSGYAMLGRALAVASEYESNCRALAVLLRVKEEPRLLDNKEMLAEFMESAWKRMLKQNIDVLKGKLKLKDEDEFVSKLSIARKARNYVAHESALVLHRIYENDSERERLTDELSNKVRELAGANLIVLVIYQAITKEPIPTAEYLLEYPEQIVQWVCVA